MLVTAWRLEWVSDCAKTDAGTMHKARAMSVNRATDFDDMRILIQPSPIAPLAQAGLDTLCGAILRYCAGILLHTQCYATSISYENDTKRRMRVR